MRGNTFGRFLSLTTFGESHGPALGAVVDGCPSGIPLCEEDFQSALRRRRPGSSSIVSARMEPDTPEILSGIFEGRTLGTPIAVIVRNVDARPADYSPDEIRPGHADEAWKEKFGHSDFRGGGRSSGRETLSRVIGGVVAARILTPDVRIVAFTKSVGDMEAAEVPDPLTIEAVDAHPTRCPDSKVSDLMLARLEECRRSGSSLGGVAEIRIDGVPPGWGEPVFRKLKSELAKAFLSIGGTTGVEIGMGFGAARAEGASFHGSSEGAGGIQGGLSTGRRIVARAAFKPSATAGAKARSGRHDPCIVPRAVPVMEAMAALVLADFALASRLDRI